MVSRIEDDVPYSEIIKFREEYLNDKPKGASGKDTDFVWQGRVTAIDYVVDSATALGTCKVLIRGEECHPVRWVSGCELSVGSVVWGIQEGRIKIIFGVLGTQGTSRLGYNAAPITGVNFTADTVIRDVPHLGVACGAVKAKTLLRVDWKIFSTSGQANMAWWFMLMKSEGALGTQFRVDQFDHQSDPGWGKGVGCSMSWITDQDYSNLCMWIAVQTSTASGTCYLSTGDTSKNQHSFIIVENMGSMA